MTVVAVTDTVDQLVRTSSEAVPRPLVHRAAQERRPARGPLEDWQQALALEDLAAAIAAQERLVTNTKRAYWTPLIAAQFSFDEFLSEGGEGTGAADRRGVEPEDELTTPPVETPLSEVTWKSSSTKALPVGH